jgi:hypothetical protein
MIGKLKPEVCVPRSTISEPLKSRRRTCTDCMPPPETRSTELPEPSLCHAVPYVRPSPVTVDVIAAANALTPNTHG